MKKILLLIGLMLSVTSLIGQTELWGMTADGGTSNAGTIFKIDGNGENLIKKHEWSKHKGTRATGNLILADNGKLYGVTSNGGKFTAGTLYEYDPSTNTLITKLDFDRYNTGVHPNTLLKASNGKIYGTTGYGGAYEGGVFFEYDISTNTIIKKMDFGMGYDGRNPRDKLIEANNGKLYGVLVNDGVFDAGVLYKYDPSTDAISYIKNFSATFGKAPASNAIQASNGKLYGVTLIGGAHNSGVLYELDLNTNIYIKRVEFDGGTLGGVPQTSLLEASNGKLYGTTSYGAANNMGGLYEFDPSTNTITKKIDFDGTNTGMAARGDLIEGSDGKLYGLTSLGGLNDGVLFSYDISTGVLTKKIDFDSLHTGNQPYSGLLQLSNGKMYSVASYGGRADKGTLFEYVPSTNTITKKIDFGFASEGDSPIGSLMQTSSGKMFGVAISGGINDEGVLFEYDLSTDTYTNKIHFDGANIGAAPFGRLLQTSNGRLFGLTNIGGVNDFGTLYEYIPSTNTIVKKIDFTASISIPQANLVEANNGKLYSVTLLGGTYGFGTLYEYDPNTNILTKKIDFNTAGGDSYYPNGLMLANNGKLYGTALYGGIYDFGTLYEYDISTNTITKKIDFDDTNNGKNPVAEIIQASNGKLYSTTNGGGVHNKGTLYEYDISTNTITKKVDFDGINKGQNPQGALTESDNGNLYGMTTYGGDYQGANSEFGVLYEYNPSTSVYTKKIDFTSANGAAPASSQLLKIDLSLLDTTNEVISNFKITVYPNPTNSMLIFQSEKEIENITIHNIIGQKLVEFSNTNIIDISNLSNGTYTAKVSIGNHKTIIKKIIKY